MIDEIQQIVDDSKANGVPATLSSVSRITMRRGLDKDPSQAEVHEILASVWQMISGVMNRLKTESLDSLPRYLEEELDKIRNGKG